MSRRRRRGIAMASTIAVVALVTLLAVASLAVSTRLEQGSSLALRDARLDAGAGFAAATVMLEWQMRSFHTLPVGATRVVDVSAPGGVSARSLVTRLGAELFWITGEALAMDGARRRESLLVRLAVPGMDSIAALTVAGDVSLTGQFTIERTPVTGCTSTTADVALPPGRSITSTTGPIPAMTIVRDTAPRDPARLLRVAALLLASRADPPDQVITGGATIPAPVGFTHATGDLIVTGGTGSGVLLVDGKLTISGPVSFTGLIVAAKGMTVPAEGAGVTGAVRVGSRAGSFEAAASFGGRFVLRVDQCALQAAVASTLTPRPVAGRRWAELF